MYENIHAKDILTREKVLRTVQHRARAQEIYLNGSLGKQSSRGLWSRNCPLDLLFRDLPGKLKEIWEKRGKPVTEKVILGGYPELLGIYERIRQACAEYWKGKLEPDIYKELTTLLPHDADRIHVNLLWEAKVPLEVVAGQYLGRGEGIGLVDRIWLSTDTIKKYYLSLTQRSERFQKIKAQIIEYSKRLNGKERTKKEQNSLQNRNAA